MLITIFTPTYNRAHLLPRLYESLCKQTFKDFEWVIVDDGSVDETHEKVKDDKNIAGIVGLDCYDNGSIIGSGLPKDVIDCNAIEIRLKYQVTGDLKEVFRISVLREFPFPEIDGERFCPEQLVWFRIAQKYKLRYFNKPIYIAEYQEQGITSNITNVRMKSPIASMMTYAELNSYDIPFASKIKAAINYWRFRFCSDAAEKPSLAWWWGWTAPIGYLMHLNDVRESH